MKRLLFVLAGLLVGFAAGYLTALPMVGRRVKRFRGGPWIPEDGWLSEYGRIGRGWAGPRLGLA